MVSNRFGKCLTVLAYFEFDDSDVHAVYGAIDTETVCGTEIEKFPKN